MTAYKLWLLTAGRKHKPRVNAPLLTRFVRWRRGLFHTTLPCQLTLLLLAILQIKRILYRHLLLPILPLLRDLNWKWPLLSVPPVLLLVYVAYHIRSLFGLYVVAINHELLELYHIELPAPLQPVDIISLFYLHRRTSIPIIRLSCVLLNKLLTASCKFIVLFMEVVVVIIYWRWNCVFIEK